MKYQYIIDVWDVTIDLDVEDDNQKTAPAYAGENAPRVKELLSTAYGAWGHIFDPDSTTANDLDAAVMSTFGPRAQRLGPTPSYSPGIPEGAQT